MPESKPLKSFPAHTTEGVRPGEPCIVEIHDNGYAYVRPVQINDLPGFNQLRLTDSGVLEAWLRQES